MTEDRNDSRSERSERAPSDPARRRFLARTSGVAMLAGLASGYGALALVAGRYLYPARPTDKIWTFVTETDRMREGDSLLFETATGERVNITRQGSSGGAGDFSALSSICPHLGCQVHWEAHNERYFCPCHNGVFDAEGVGREGPPGDAGQNLPRYALDVRDGLLFIEVAAGTGVADGGRVIDAAPSAAGHDPCLDPSRNRRTERA